MLIILICLMPVIGAWGWTLLPLGLLLILKSGEWRPGGWEFGLVGLTFGVTTALSTGFQPGRNGFDPRFLLETEGWILMAWLVSWAIPRELGQKVLRFLVLTSLIWIFLGLQQLAAGVPTNPGWLEGAQPKLIPIRIFSVFVNPNIYALYLLGVLVFAVEFAALRLNLGLKVTYGIVAGLALLSLYFTYSRMAWILAGIYGFGRLIHSLKWRGLIVIIVGFSGLLAIPAFRIRLGSLVNFTDSSLHYRIQIWRGVVRALGSFWLWGAGPGSFPAIYPLYQIGNTPAQHAHQLYLQIWLEYGIFGLAGFIFLVIQLLRNSNPLGLRTVLLIYLGYGFSETWYLNHYVGGFFWLAAGLLGTASGRGQNQPDQKELKDNKEEQGVRGIGK
ncbi:MAG TPA: O-antigen ligase family protein [Bacillota bacterium]|nr:O-antigen ligase family protein [Bacillota bacterium]